MTQVKELKKQTQKLEENELTKVRSLNEEFNTLKVSLADVELQKLLVIEKIQGIKEQFSMLEQTLIQKYGANSVINLETGEVKEKE